ncbi:putative MFS family arabinose efflux permease [Hungatella effluvii]|uniref:Putative MFS family arabinose efflux permease n=1 Tax=Hungatella effluvii TaxID=1096246 RepID=A0A2V3XYD2_9FIRM|nr:MFS transporter [Hungatella effluvii]PXX46373.1 putative MFS family arabinose efflux permease [Hungatella effluvii]
MKKNPWFRFLILQCCAVTVSVSQLKVAAVMEQVAQGFSISMGAAAGLMSFFTVAGIVLAIPGAALMERMGAKRLLLLLMACLFAGNAVGAAAGSYPLLMAGRLLEGVAYAMIIMVGIDLINTWFPHGGAGTATGIFNTFAAVGNFITLNGALMVVKRWNVRTLWWIGAALAAVDFILVLAFIPDEERIPAEKRIPDERHILAEKPIWDRCRNRERGSNASASSTGAMVREAFRDKRLMSLGAAQMLMAFILFGFITCYPLLFTGYYHLAPEKANFYSSLNGLFGIPACIVCGILAEKTGNPCRAAMAGAVGTVIAGFTMLILTPGTYVVHVLASAVFPGGLVMTSIFCMVPAIAKRKESVGYYMAVVNLLYYTGVFFATPVMVKLMEVSWPAAAGTVAVMAAASLVFLWRCAAEERAAGRS